MPVAHNVVRISGSLPGGEVWSVNPKYGPGPEGLKTSYEDLLAWAEGIVGLNDGNILPAGLRSILSSAAAITSIRCEYRDASGNLAQAAEAVPTSPVPGTLSATKPYQTSLVSSLLTGRPGRSYRGRLYWPALSLSIGTADLRVADSVLATVTAAINTALSQIATIGAPENDLVLSVVSETLSVVTPVTQISCGDVLDVQRRRRDSLLEGRVTVEYPPAP